MMPRPNSADHIRSITITWKGTEPTIEQSHWAPGYTPAHLENNQQALAYELMRLTKEIAAIREKWVKLNLLIAKERGEQAEQDAFGITVTKTPDMNEQIVDEDFANAPRIDKE